MNSPLTLPQITQTIEDLAMIGSQNYDLGIIVPKNRPFESLKR